MSHMSSNYTMSESDPSEIHPVQQDLPSLPTKDKRLVEWHVSMLSKFLQQIQARRNIMREKKIKPKDMLSMERSIGLKQGVALDEVQEIINLPTFTAETYLDYSNEGDKEVLDEQVRSELRQLVTEIAATYHDNPFHNFEQ